ncbi:MAG: DUF2892 domain-containing protein [Verrucomicrobia bacterium]|nr:DUF2892 domain-containing protein [Prolixibacteraceae bacterium]
MKKNVGTTDKVIRILAAVVIIALYLTNVISGTLAIVLLVVSGLLILTSFVSFCPMYWPFGISTRTQKV